MTAHMHFQQQQQYWEVLLLKSSFSEAIIQFTMIIALDFKGQISYLCFIYSSSVSLPDFFTGQFFFYFAIICYLFNKSMKNFYFIIFG